MPGTAAFYSNKRKCKTQGNSCHSPPTRSTTGLENPPGNRALSPFLCRFSFVLPVYLAICRIPSPLVVGLGAIIPVTGLNGMNKM